jgi:hypothetical protein
LIGKETQSNHSALARGFDRVRKLEQIVTLLRQTEVEMANGKTTPQACK